MDTYTIEAVERQSGKGASRAARRQKMIPCVVYGRKVENVHLQLPEIKLEKLIFTNKLHRVNLRAGDQSWDCIMKDISFHPVTDRPMHVDFQVLKEDQKVTVKVPLAYEGIPKGQTAGGVTDFVLHDLEISCLPADLPSQLKIDITDLEIGQSLQVSNLEYEGISFLGDARRTLAFVKIPRTIEEDEEAEESAEMEEEVEDSEEEQS